MRGFTSLIVAVGFLVLAADSATASILTGPITNPTNGHRYFLLEQDTWTNSEAAATALGGHLVTINDQDENDWVYDTFASYGGVQRNLWIGLNDTDQEGTFVWTSGEAVTYTNWADGEPNNSIDHDPGGEHYVHIWRPGSARDRQWNDLLNDPTLIPASSAADPPYGVVEVVPEPAIVALLGLGGLALLPRRQRRT